MMSTVTISYLLLLIVELLAFASPTFMPPIAHMLLAASFTVYVSCHAAISLAQSRQQAEDLTTANLLTGVLGGLTVLFVALKYFDRSIINRVIQAYIVFVATVSIGEIIRSHLPKSMKTRYSGEDLVHVKFSTYIDVHITRLDVLVFVVAMPFTIPYLFKQHWLLNNIIAIGLSIGALPNIVIGKYSTAVQALLALFVYDIVMVYFTPMMIEVATSIDAPIKLVFPQTFNTATGTPAFSLLGLGDIVVPCVYMALVLRYEVQRWFKVNPAAKVVDVDDIRYDSIAKPVFLTTWVFYVIGLLITIGVMHYWESGQPALFFLVPCVLLSSTIAVLFRGDFKALREHDDENYAQWLSAAVKEQKAD